MTIYNVVLSGSTLGGTHPVEYSGASFSPNKHLIYLLPITTTTTTFFPGCELFCIIDCYSELDCWNSGGTAEIFTGTTTTTLSPTTTTTTIPTVNPIVTCTFNDINDIINNYCSSTSCDVSKIITTLNSKCVNTT